MASSAAIRFVHLVADSGSLKVRVISAMQRRVLLQVSIVELAVFIALLNPCVVLFG